MSNILLIDLSSIAHLMFHASGDDPNPDATSIKTIERVRALASGQPHVAVCLDTPPYFRMTVDPTYKAKREKDNNAVIGHQIAITADALKADGFPVWGAQGYEADDVIASAIHEALLADEGAVTIVSADKDLLQLVSERVTVKSLKDGSLIGPNEVQAKFHVAPHQIADYLALVGDKGDNVRGAEGIGAVKAAALLQKFGNLDDVYRALDSEPSAFANSTITSLREFQPRMATVRDLIRLRTDVPLPFDDVFKERVAADVAVFIGETMDELIHRASSPERCPDERESVLQGQGPSGSVATADRADHTAAATVDHPAWAANLRRDGAVGENPASPQSSESNGIGVKAAPRQPSSAVLDPVGPSAPSQSLAPREPDIISAAPVEWERQLEPRSMNQAHWIASRVHASKLSFGAYGSPDAVLTTVLAGREIGLSAMASLRAFHVVEGKPTLSADAIRALVMRSPQCEYFRITVRDAVKATWVTKRRGDPEVSLTYTIEEGRAAWQKDQKAWDASAWGKRPANMVTKTASSTLARLIYPDVVGGFYCPEELTGEER